jgi:hypothetical protein
LKIGLAAKVTKLFSLAVIEEPSSNDILVYLLIIITSVLAISLIFLFTMLCEYFDPLKHIIHLTKSDFH